jgi:hypothetical protein
MSALSFESLQDESTAMNRMGIINFKIMPISLENTQKLFEFGKELLFCNGRQKISP